MTNTIIVKIGDIVCSDFGKGAVIAITKQWLVHKDENGNEVALYLEDNLIWLPEESYKKEDPGEITETTINQDE